MKTRHLTLSLLALCLVLGGCRRRTVMEHVRIMVSEHVDTTHYAHRAYTLPPFQSIDAACFADFTFHQTAPDSKPRVEVWAPRELLGDMKVSVVNGELRFILDRSGETAHREMPVIHIYAPFVYHFGLHSVKCLRLGHLAISTPLSIEVEGVGLCTAASLKAPEVQLTVSGAGTVRTDSLLTPRLAIHGAGSADITLGGLQVDQCDARLAGACQVEASGRIGQLNKRLSGASSFHLTP